jgi:hypothetical protein
MREEHQDRRWLRTAGWRGGGPLCIDPLLCHYPSDLDELPLK